MNEQVKIKIKNIPGIEPPKKAKSGDFCYDIMSNENVTITPGCGKIVSTGLFMEIPSGYGVILKDRSGLSSKGILIGGGVIDSGYRGEIRVIMWNVGDCNIRIKKGDKIAQMKIERMIEADFEIVDELSETERGDTGFGSSDIPRVSTPKGKIRTF